MENKEPLRWNDKEMINKLEEARIEMLKYMEENNQYNINRLRSELLSERLKENHEKYKKIAEHYDLYLTNIKPLKEYRDKLIGEGIEPIRIITQEELDNIK